MRRKLVLLLMSTWLALAGAVVAAAPAGAVPKHCPPGWSAQGADGERRNVGGFVPTDDICSCFPAGRGGERRNVGGTGPADGFCPPGLAKIRIDRNVGG